MVTHCCPTEGKWLVVFKFHSGPNFLLFQTYLSGRWGKQVLLSEMVQLHVKRGDESLFLFNTTVDTPLETLIQQITAIYNGRLKVERLCSGENTPSVLPRLKPAPHYCWNLTSVLVHSILTSFVSLSSPNSIIQPCKWASDKDLLVPLCALRDSRACRPWHLTATQHAGADRGADWGAKPEGWMGRKVHPQWRLCV